MAQEIEPVKPVLAAELMFDERETFDRLDGESQLEYSWFQHYARTGRKRSYRETSAFMEISREAIQKAATRHSWRVRVEAYDDFVDARSLQEIEGRQIEVRSAHAEMFKDAREKLVAAIALVNPFTLNPRDIPAWMEVVSKGERLTVGISDAPKRIEITGKDGGAIEVSASADERQTRLAELMGEISRRMGEIEALQTPEIIDAELVEVEDGSRAEGQPE